MIFSHSKVMALGVLAAAALLAGCVVEDSGHRPQRPNIVTPQACPMNYMPVCGERAGVRKTMANDCQARAEGFRIVSRGECGNRPGNGWGSGNTGGGRPNGHSGNSSNQDKPGHNGGNWGQTARPPQGGGGNRPSANAACTRDYNPVCARRGSDSRTFPNSCEAERAGYRVSNGGQCR